MLRQGAADSGLRVLAEQSAERAAGRRLPRHAAGLATRTERRCVHQTLLGVLWAPLRRERDGGTSIPLQGTPSPRSLVPSRLLPASPVVECGMGDTCTRHEARTGDVLSAWASGGPGRGRWAHRPPRLGASRVPLSCSGPRVCRGLRGARAPASSGPVWQKAQPPHGLPPSRHRRTLRGPLSTWF